MARKITRKSKPEIRWDASSGGFLPLVKFDEATRLNIAELCGSEDVIDLLQDHTAQFLLDQELTKKAPTYADYEANLSDLDKAAGDFLARLRMLRGHELEDLLIAAAYRATKTLPDWNALEAGVEAFRRYVWLAQNALPEFRAPNGRAETAGPIRAFMRICVTILESNVKSAPRSRDGNVVRLALLCLHAAGVTRYDEALHHYLPKKVAKK